MENLNMGVT